MSMMTECAASQRRPVLERLTSAGEEFEVALGTVQGRQMRVYTGGPPTLRELALGLGAHGDQTFLVFGSESLSFKQHSRLVAGLARYLHDECGLRKGQRLALAMRNYPEWSAFFFAGQILGLIVVPLNAWWTGPELAHGLLDSRPAMVVADSERTARIAPYLEEVGAPVLVEVRGQGRQLPGVLRWEEIQVALDLTASPPEIVVEPDDDATILYTSGTTGRPKGAVGSHRNHCTNLRNSQLNARVSALINAGQNATSATAADLQPGVLCTFPLFHVGGLTSLGNAALSGGKVVLQYKWDREEALTLIRREAVTSIAGVPTVLRQLLEDAARRPQDVATLVSASCGGSAVPPDLVQRIAEGLDHPLSPSNGYGLTETTSAVAFNAGDDYVARPDSVGQCLPGTDVRVVDPETCLDVSEGEVGELWFRGPTVVRGYWDAPTATAEAFRDGWFRSGDLGRVVDDWVFVVDRLKDVIIRGGENIYCAEVEAALFEHPDVEDAVLIGLPDDTLGEQAVAVVVPRAGALPDGAALRHHVAQRLAAFKVPSRVVFQRDELPRTASGKVLKRELRTALSEGLGE